MLILIDDADLTKIEGFLQNTHMMELQQTQRF